MLVAWLQFHSCIQNVVWQTCSDASGINLGLNPGCASRAAPRLLPASHQQIASCGGRHTSAAHLLVASCVCVLMCVCATPECVSGCCAREAPVSEQADTASQGLASCPGLESLPYSHKTELLCGICAAASTSLAQGCHPAAELSMLQQACPRLIRSYPSPCCVKL